MPDLNRRAYPGTPRPRKECGDFAASWKMEPINFQRLPTRMLVTEYYYDIDANELKVHLYLQPGVVLRELWEILAESFGPQYLAFTREAYHNNGDGTILKGSVGIFMPVTFDRMHGVLCRLSEIDNALLNKGKR
jgi:hypothetical protein